MKNMLPTEAQKKYINGYNTWLDTCPGQKQPPTQTYTVLNTRSRMHCLGNITI